MGTLDEYLQVPYRLSLIWDEDDEGQQGWVAEIPELPGCISQGATPEEAVTNVRDAMAGWISVALEDGRPIPEPLSDEGYSGKLLLRLPRSLHATLAREAEAEGVSLNALLTSTLARSVGRREAQEGAPA